MSNHKPEPLEADRTCGHDEREQSRIVTTEGEIIDVCQDCRWQREWDNRANHDVVEEMFDE